MTSTAHAGVRLVATVSSGGRYEPRVMVEVPLHHDSRLSYLSPPSVSVARCCPVLPATPEDGSSWMSERSGPYRHSAVIGV